MVRVTPMFNSIDKIHSRNRVYVIPQKSYDYSLKNASLFVET